MNEFTYSSIFKHLKMWFMSRWWDVLADNNTIMDYINLTIQDIYNTDSATFLWKTEDLVWELVWDKRIFKTSFPIRKVQRLRNANSCNDMTPTLFSIDSSDEFKFEWNQIITNSDCTNITVTYVMDYTFASYPEDMNKAVPLPKRYLPTLLKLTYDWASPINLMDWEMQNIDMYSHWKTRLNELATMDWLTDYMDVKPSYK